ncbi:hypothetical protein [Bradyrhizobium manausense]|uniref:hypothetical protein n=1 Tax=Bradyrhizobium manausense TaxID=989370 RepID=UPI001BA7E6D4|nr:hypothetical protein [Bradyrhizobium manausense]MBR0725043.1 hypothetical protein [Bradyrhizobium manausense]
MPDDHLSFVTIGALLSWPLVTFAIFACSSTIGRALIISFVSAQLFLPVGAAIKISMLPAIDKASVTSLSALAACFVYSKRWTSAAWPKFGLVELLLLMSLVGPIVTSILNGDNIIIGVRFLPGVGLYDALSAAEAAFISLVPFILARRVLNSEEEIGAFLQVVAISGAFYSILLLFEVRFSPQLHFWVYGYYPSDFVQTVRDGGFRPMAFMGHGLLAAFFLMASLLAAVSMWRTRPPGKTPWSAIAWYLGIVLLICKSLASLIYGTLASALIIFVRPKSVVSIACILTALSLSYPVLRALGLVPTTSLVEIARTIDTERAGSLQFRLDNEDRLLERALERPIFGWGRFGRSRIYDPQTGKDLSITDGRWIIDIGQFGFVGLFAEFGLLGLCVFRSARTFRSVEPAARTYVAALTLLLAINVIDLLPNSSILPLTWLIAGALLGASERTARQQKIARRHAPRRREAGPTLIGQPIGG